MPINLFPNTAGPLIKEANATILIEALHPDVFTQRTAEQIPAAPVFHTPDIHLVKLGEAAASDGGPCDGPIRQLLCPC